MVGDTVREDYKEAAKCLSWQLALKHEAYSIFQQIPLGGERMFDSTMTLIFTFCLRHLIVALHWARMGLTGIGVDMLYIPRMLDLLRRRGSSRLARRILSRDEYQQWSLLSNQEASIKFLATR